MTFQKRISKVTSSVSAASHKEGWWGLLAELNSQRKMCQISVENAYYQQCDLASKHPLSVTLRYGLPL